MSKAREIAQSWVDYVERERLRKNTAKYQDRQHAFVSGVFASLGHDTPPIITIYALSGRDLYDLAHEPELV